MKRAIVASVLGLAGSIATSYGQGIILFNNYISHSYQPVVYANGANVNTGNVEVDLFYALGTFTSVGSFLSSANEVGSTTIDTGLNTGGAYGGTGPGGFYDDGTTINLAGWTTSQTATFLVEGWDTTTGANYGVAGTKGQTGLWTEVVDPQYPINSQFSGYGIVPSSATVPEPMFSGMPELTLTAAPVPEPTTLALAGLGGLASLVALRRKKA